MFDKLFEGKELPLIKEQLGVMSVESLERQWQFVKLVDGNRIVAVMERDGTCLMGRMGVREDGKRAIAIEVRAWIQKGTLNAFEFWHVAIEDQPVRSRQLWDAMQGHLG